MIIIYTAQNTAAILLIYIVTLQYCHNITAMFCMGKMTKKDDEKIRLFSKNKIIRLPLQLPDA